MVYGPSKTWYDSDTHNTKTATGTETDIHALKKYTNYTMQVMMIMMMMMMMMTKPIMQVLAYTDGGDGVRSDLVTATTEQDLPGPPGSVKALAMSQDSILIR